MEYQTRWDRNFLFWWSKVSLTENITLYAQWEEKTLKVIFNANNGTSEFITQSICESVSTKLDKNTFTRVGYIFKNWNTKPNGTGTSYSDGEEISITSDLTLYAIWEKELYSVTFDANGGKFTNGKTTIIIAHRITTLKDLDKIVVVEEGKITGVGKHEELVQSNSFYSNEVKLQELEKEAN